MVWVSAVGRTCDPGQKVDFKSGGVWSGVSTVHPGLSGAHPLDKAGRIQRARV